MSTNDSLQGRPKLVKRPRMRHMHLVIRMALATRGVPCNKGPRRAHCVVAKHEVERCTALPLYFCKVNGVLAEEVGVPE